jgi:hypothetical protein
VNHPYQRQQPFPFTASIELAAHQRACYIAWIWTHIHSFSPQIIFDEMNLAEGDYKFAESGIPWVYMDIPEHVREKFDLKVARTEEALIPRVDEPREKYWLNLVEQMVIACDTSKAMVICGAAHLDSFGVKLRDRGHVVTAFDMRSEAWYDDRWLRSGPT